MTDELATKADLKAVRDDLKAAMVAMEERLTLEIGKAVSHALAVYSEQTQSRIGVIDDKYAPLPARVASVERAMEEHRTDYGLHKRPRKPTGRG